MIAQLPKNETLWVSHYDEKGKLHYIVTSDKLRNVYFLYKVVRGTLQKISRGKTPEKFLDRIDIYKETEDD